MSTQTYELEECFGNTHNSITEMKAECATPLHKNLFGETLYQVREGVAIRTHKKTEGPNGVEMRTTLLLEEEALFVPRAGNVVANSAFVESQERCNARWYHLWTPTLSASLYFKQTSLLYLEGYTIEDPRFNGLDRGIYATTRDSHWFDFCN